MDVEPFGALYEGQEMIDMKKLGKWGGSILAGATATAAIPAGAGLTDWRILAGAAALGAVGGAVGVNVADIVKKRMAAAKDVE